MQHLDPPAIFALLSQAMSKLKQVHVHGESMGMELMYEYLHKRQPLPIGHVTWLIHAQIASHLTAGTQKSPKI